MGLERPDTVDSDGDQSVVSPRQTDASILATEVGTNKPRRLTTTSDRELRVAITSGGGSGGLTNTELRATPVPVSGSVTVLNPTTNPETGLAKDLTLTNGTQKTEVTNFPSSQAVTGPLTDTQLRAVAVPVSGPLTDVQLRATPVPVSGAVTTGGLTDTQLRATPVPVSGTVTTGGLTDTQLRAVAVPVSGTFFQTTQPISGTVAANAGTNLNTSLLALESGGNLAAVTTAIQIMDDWDETDRAKVNPVVGQAGVQGGSGAVSANTQRVVVATDQTSIPVTTAAVAGTLANGAETAVAGSAVQVLAANASSKVRFIQNTGVANVRVGVTGVTATTGIRLTPGSMVIFEMPYCPQAALFAIREGATSSTVLAQEIT